MFYVSSVVVNYKIVMSSDPRQHGIYFVLYNDAEKFLLNFFLRLSLACGEQTKDQTRAEKSIQTIV